MGEDKGWRAGLSRGVKVVGAIVTFIVLVLGGLVSYRTLNPAGPPKIEGSVGCHSDGDAVDVDKLMNLKTGERFDADLITSWSGVANSKSAKPAPKNTITDVSSAADSAQPGECHPDNTDPYVTISTVAADGTPVDGWHFVGGGMWRLTGPWKLHSAPTLQQGYYGFVFEPAPDN